MSYNSLFGLGSHSQDASLLAWYKLTDNAASTTVVNSKTGGTNAAASTNTENMDVAGPNGWLATALQLNGNDRHISLTGLNSGITTGSSTYLIRCKPLAQKDGHIFSNNGNAGAYGFSIEQEAVSASNSRIRGFVANSASSAAYINSTTQFVGATNTAWYSVALAAGVNGSKTNIYINGSSQAQINTDGWAQQYNQTAYGAAKIGNRGQYNAPFFSFNGAVSDASVFNRLLSAAEVLEWHKGPEPLGLTNPVLNTDGTVTSGTWNSQSNGTITRETKLYLDSDDSLVHTLSGENPDFSSYVTPGQAYYVVERASNDGDYDENEDATSAVETIGGGGGGTDNLTANGITTGAPSLGSPMLAQTHGLTGTAITTGSPSLGSPTLAQTHSLTGTAITTGNPSLGSPTLAQVHGLSGAAISAGSPSLGSPTLSQAHSLTGTAITTGAPTLGSPVIAQVHGLTATSIATGAPTLGSPTLGIEGSLIGQPITTGTPTLSSPALGQTHVLQASSIAAGTPSLGQPAIGQTHTLSAVGISTGSPTLSSPTLSSTVTYNLSADPITTGTPTLGQPTLGQTFVLTGVSITTGAPTVSVAAIGQVHVLTASEIITGAPTVGTPRRSFKAINYYKMMLQHAP